MADFLHFVGERFTTLVRAGEAYVFLLPIYALMLSGERIAHEITQQRKWDDRDGAANLAITFTHMLMDLFLGHLLPLAALIWLYEHARITTLGDGALGWIAGFLLYDLCWYVDHRIAHRSGFFWAFHHVHHSSREYNFTVASRGFLFDTWLTRPLFYLLPILGVSPFQYIAIQILTDIFGIFQHTRLIRRMPILDAILATPSNHRVHHGSDVVYLDRNYGKVLILWDKLFGTYQPELTEPTFGLTKNIATYNPLTITVWGIVDLWKNVKSAPTWTDRLQYLVRPPGWRHDGQGATTEDLRLQSAS